MAETSANIGMLNSQQRADLAGEFQKNFKDLEQWFSVTCRHSGSTILLSGELPSVKQAYACLNNFIENVKLGDFTEQKASELLMMHKNHHHPDELNEQVKLRKARIIPKSSHQNQYLTRIEKFDVNFGVGPAGTGKTYLAVAKAVEALEQE